MIGDTTFFAGIVSSKKKYPRLQDKKGQFRYMCGFAINSDAMFTMFFFPLAFLFDKLKLLESSKGLSDYSLSKSH